MAKGIKSRLQEIVSSEYKVIYILWKYYPEYFNKEFKDVEELADNYKMFPKSTDKQMALNWEIDEEFQRGVKFLLEVLHNKKMIEIYNKFYEQSKNGDTQSAKFFIDFSEQLFNEKQSQIEQLLSGIDIDDD
jgi:dimeric dUTPase (all-alpha-NTP-PPase superfamily)